MIVNLHHYEFNLGCLTYVDGKYLWEPNTEGIRGAIKKYELEMEMFFLPVSACLYEKIPHHFDEFLETADRPDLAKKAGILATDTDMEKLYKLSKLNYFNQNFVIKS